jgi:hypothetical protein
LEPLALKLLLLSRYPGMQEFIEKNMHTKYDEANPTLRVPSVLFCCRVLTEFVCLQGGQGCIAHAAIAGNLGWSETVR